MALRLLGLAWWALIFASGCVKKTIEVRVKDARWVGLSRPGPSGLSPVLVPGTGDSFARLANVGPGQVVTVERQPGLMVVEWPGTPQPLVLVDPSGALPAEKPGDGFEAREGWVFGSYKLTPKQILPAAARNDFATPVVVMTPVTNLVDVREVREPLRWPAYVFLPTGGVFTLVGCGALAISANASDKDKEAAELAAAAYLLTGIPMVVYGLINAFDSTEYAPVTPPREGSF